MSRNGSGTYSLPAGNPVTTGATISSTTHNNTLSDIATALSDSLAKDGQTTPTASLPMGGYAHTGVGDATARTQYAKVSQIQDGGYVTLSSVSGADTITATCAPAITAYAAGQFFTFVSAGANTGAVTLNINSLGAKSVTKEGATALAAGDIASGAVVCVEYDGTRFQLVGGRALGAILAALAGLDASTGLVYQTGADAFSKIAYATAVQSLLDAISTTHGNVLYYNGTDWVALSPGTSGQFLKTLGAGANPAWEDVSSLGVSQTWQDKTASRALGGAGYTNSTGKPIQVNVVVTVPASGGGIKLTVGGVIVSKFSNNMTGTNIVTTLSATVPTGTAYIVEATALSPTIDAWLELTA